MATEQKPALLTHRIANTVHFYSYPDMARECLDRAYALLTMLAAGEECAAVAEETNRNELDALGNCLKAQGYEGLKTLIALAQFAIEQDGRCVA